MKRSIFVLFCSLLLVLLLTGCPGNTGIPTGPAVSAPTLLNAWTSADNAGGIHPGEFLLVYVTFTDQQGDVNNGQAVIIDETYRPNGTKRYDSIAYTTPGAMSGTLEITITIDLLTATGPDHLFTIVVFDRAGNQSNTVYATVNIL